MQLGSALEEFFLKEINFPEKKEVMEFYLNLRHFLNMYDLMDENYVIYTEHEAEGRFKPRFTFCRLVNIRSNLFKFLLVPPGILKIM